MSTERPIVCQLTLGLLVFILLKKFLKNHYISRKNIDSKIEILVRFIELEIS